MDLKKVLKIKELEEKERARNLKEINEAISKLKREKAKLEREVEFQHKLIAQERDPMRAILHQKALISKIESLDREIKKLLRQKEAEEENLRDIKREEKAINLLKEKDTYERYAQNLRREFLQLGFIHLIKRSLKILLVFTLLSMAQSATQEKLMQMESEKRTERYRELEKIIEAKLQKLIEERKKLEALKKRPLTEKEQKEVQKLIKIVSKTPSDEAGAILNEVEPRIAAEILIRLKERQAGQILAAMDPKKAAKITEIIMSWRIKGEQKRQP